jgi:hypothetical protein
MRSNLLEQPSPDGFEAPKPSELLQPLMQIWPAEGREDFAVIADYLYKVANEQPEIITRLAPLRDAAALAQVRNCAITRPDLFTSEFAAMKRILMEALRTEGSGEWGRTYLIMNFPALLLDRIGLRIRPFAAPKLSPFVYAMQ